MPLPVHVGDPFPAFSLSDASGTPVTLANYAGKNIVIYFYPKDNTPGCTVEGHDFTAFLPEFRAKGVEVLGISVDSPASHQSFETKQRLTHRLLSDEQRSLVTALGILKPTKSRTAQRTTFLVDKKGKIAKIYENVKVLRHAQRVLADIDSVFAPG